MKKIYITLAAMAALAIPSAFAQDEIVANFDFSSYENMKKMYAELPETGKWADKGSGLLSYELESFSLDGVTIAHATKAGGTNSFGFYYISTSKIFDFRIGANQAFTVTAPENFQITKFVFTNRTSPTAASYLTLDTPNAPKLSRDKKVVTWEAEAGSKTRFTSLTFSSPTFGQSVSSIEVTVKPIESGINDIEASDADNAPAVYYNLQGVRVDNPANGIFIRRTGNSSAKVKL